MTLQLSVKVGSSGSERLAIQSVLFLVMSEQRDTEIGVFDRVFNGAARARRELVAQMERNGSGQQVDSFIVAFSRYPMDSLPQ